MSKKKKKKNNTGKSQVKPEGNDKKTLTEKFKEREKKYYESGEE